MLYRRPAAPEGVGGEGDGAVREQWAQQQQSDVSDGGQGRHERRGEVHLSGLPAPASRRRVRGLAGPGLRRNRAGLSTWCLPWSEAPTTVPPGLLRGLCGVSRPCETVSIVNLR